MFAPLIAKRPAKTVAQTITKPVAWTSSNSVLRRLPTYNHDQKFQQSQALRHLPEPAHIQISNASWDFSKIPVHAKGCENGPEQSSPDKAPAHSDSKKAQSGCHR